MTVVSRSRPGISLVELVVAVGLLSLVSLAAIQLMNITETTLITSQAKLDEQQRSDAISSYVYKDFARGRLNDTVDSQVYQNSDMPDDLRNGGSVTVVTLFGNQDRYSEGDPVCPLTADIDLESSSFKMMASCANRTGRSVVSQMNSLIAKGVVLTTGFQDGVGRCSISKPITVDPVTGVATIEVDDKNCLGRSDDPTRGLQKGKQVLLPRFVAYDTDMPRSFFTSMIESPDIATPDIELDMPDTYSVIGGGVPNATNIVNAVSDDPLRNITVSLSTKELESQLTVTAPASVAVSGLNSSTLKLTGTAASVRAALESLEYKSPSGFMSDDILTGVLQGGSTVTDDKTKLLVQANCGGQTCGTALMFELGKTDAGNNFRRTRYITSVSKCGTELPSTFYGYCGTAFRFDRADGLRTDYPETGNNYHLNYCSIAGQLEPHDPGLTFEQNVAINRGKTDVNGNPLPQTQKFPYITYSPRFRPYQKPDYVTVFLYEQDSTPLTKAQEKDLRSQEINRYSLFFQFDTYDRTGGDVSFELSNIEKGRVMSDMTDPFTFLDDTTEYFPKVKTGQKTITDKNGVRKVVDTFITKIGGNGTLSTTAKWTRPNDGVVVPLRLGESALDNTTGFYELKHYSQDPDGDGNANPKLSLRSWNGLDGWNIRSTKVTKTPTGYKSEVAWQTFDFNQGQPDEQTDFQVVVSKAQRCPSAVPAGVTPGTPVDPDATRPDPDATRPDPDATRPDPDANRPDPDAGRNG